MGCSNHHYYHRNPKIFIEVKELTAIKYFFALYMYNFLCYRKGYVGITLIIIIMIRIRLQSLDIIPIPPMNITIFEKLPKNLFGKEIASSGTYTNIIQVTKFMGASIIKSLYNMFNVYLFH